MRKFLQPALESLSPSLYGENLSLEEEVILLTEAADEAADTERELGEVERITELADGLEDLAVIADGITEATPTEIALIENAGDMAVAGSDVSGEEIIPAMESFAGTRIATETIRERARALWESIKRALVAIWEKIESIYNKLFGTIPPLRRRLKDLRERAEAASGKRTEEKTIKITSGVTALSIDYKPVKNEAELRKGLTALAEAGKFVFGEYTDALVSTAGVISKHIAEFDADEPEKAGQALKAKLKDAFAKMNKIPSVSGSDTARYPDFKTQQGAALFGNVSLASKVFKESDNATVLGALDRYRRSGVELIPTKDKAPAEATSAEITVLSPSSMEAIIGQCESMLDTLEEFQRGKRSRDIKAARETMKGASDKATEAAGKAEADTEKKDIVVYYRALLNFNSSYTRWAKSPSVELASKTFSAIRASMIVIQKSAAAYK